MKRALSPLTRPTLARENDFAMGRWRVNDLELQARGTQVLDILVGRDQFDAPGIRIWCKNRCFTLPNGTYSVDISQAANRLDGIALQASGAYCLWAVFNEACTEFVQFAVTRKPSSVYTAVASGGLGSTATYTVAGGTLTSANQFTEGARVIVRNGGGSTPNFEWNQGTIVSVVSNTSLTIAMDANLPLATAITSTTATAEIVQLDRFRPWDGTTTGGGGADDHLYTPSYKLIGELNLEATSQIIWHRRTQDTFVPLYFQYPTVARTGAGTTSTTYHYYRYCPSWAEKIHTNNKLQTSAVATTGRSLWNVSRFVGGPSVLTITQIHSSAVIAAQYISAYGEAACRTGLGFMDLVLAVGAGTLTQQHELLGYDDGGLRE